MCSIVLPRKKEHIINNRTVKSAKEQRVIKKHIQKFLQAATQSDTGVKASYLQDICLYSHGTSACTRPI